MVKLRLIFMIACVAMIFKCTRDFEPLGSNGDQKMPNWLSNLIAERQNNPDFWGSMVYRHTWRNHYYYHFFIPISSCAYCEVYDYTGNKVDWHNNDLMDYSNNRKNEIIAWYFPRPK
jgi:hypothetical protein